MMFGLVTLVHLAESKEQLDSDTESIVSTARRHLCQMSTLRWQQKDGLDTVLPYGLRRIQALRTLTTESTAVLIPFRAQEILQEGGIYYGQNAVSKNMIVADRRKLLNGNSFRLGVSGSGKSFSAKEESVSIALATGDDILILDPESEFGTLTESLGGEVIRISASSDTHLNAMDMDGAYGDERNPLIEKSEFILSLFEQLIGAGGVSAKEKSILDRCTYDVYREYQANRFQGEPPTLRELYHALLSQPEPEARGLALSSELFITGSLNTFAQHTNVNTKARILCYDIRELGEQLMPIGMLVTLDAIFNRVIQNWKLGKTTWIFCDEFYLLFRYPYSADFFYKLWKRIRKYNGLVTGLTQNVEELLRSDTARLMLANSEFLILLNQSATDREELARLLHISETQLSYITNVLSLSAIREIIRSLLKEKARQWGCSSSIRFIEDGNAVDCRFFYEAVSDLILSALSIPEKDHEEIQNVNLRPVWLWNPEEDGTYSELLPFLQHLWESLSSPELAFAQMFADFSASTYYPSSLLPESSLQLERFHAFSTTKCYDVQSLYHAIVRLFGREIPEIQDEKQNSDNADKIERAVAYILRNYREDLSLDSVAQYVSLHPSYLSYLFKKKNGESFLHFLHKVRLQEACRLMSENPDLSLERISELVGYRTSTYFYKAFRQYFGKSPRDWQKREG